MIIFKVQPVSLDSRSFKTSNYFYLLKMLQSTLFHAGGRRDWPFQRNAGQDLENVPPIPLGHYQFQERILSKASNHLSPL